MDHEEAWGVCNDTETNWADDDDFVLFLQSDFHGTVNPLPFSRGTGTCNNPTLVGSNPLVTSPLAADRPTERESLNFQPLDLILSNRGGPRSSGRDFDNLVLRTPELGGTGPSEESAPVWTTGVNDQAAISAIVADLRNSCKEHFERQDVEAVIAAMNRARRSEMRMLTQPKDRHRFRYRSEGIRYLEESRRNPMSIELPNLTGLLVRADQSFWIRATIVTTRHNPQQKVYIHQHEIFYYGEDAVQHGPHAFHIPVTDDEAHTRQKVFRHLGVIKARQDAYVFELTPFDPLLDTDHTDFYTVPDEGNLTKKQLAKRFDGEYHTDEYQIVCDLMMKQNEQWHALGVSCQTQVVTNQQ